ncbi:MAG TPA: patatin-like phospholipase family protein [Pyrinomonadaceae bacterium]|nr:patatin-like phospholipase family protein [Pyrinomonadaceae bacterium]
MSTNFYPYRNLVFEGGGVKGVAYGGALEVLETSGITPQIVNVAGTSAGAITATLVSLKYTAAEVVQIMMGLDFATLEDGSDIGGLDRLIKNYGWFKGDAFLNLMEQYIAAKTEGKNGRATFRDFQAQNFKSLRVFSTNLTEQRLEEFSFEKTPDVAVADAVRMSMSIPFFFEAVRRAGGDVYCDGGVLDNYPIETFDTSYVEDSGAGRTMLVRTPNPATLGFHLGTLKQQPIQINHFTRFALSVFDALLDIQDILLKASPGDELRTVFINTLGIKTTDFHITDEQKWALIAQGRIATANYLSSRGAGAPDLPPVMRLHERDDAAG